MKKLLISVAVIVLCSFAPQASLGQAGSPMSSPAKLTAHNEKDSPVTLKREEQIAIMFLTAFNNIEGDCRHHSDHVCTMDEMLAGPKATDTWRIAKLKYDPKLDTNYTYTITIKGSEWTATAVPKKPGLGSFYSAGVFSHTIYYNLNGPADEKSEKIYAGIEGDLFWK